MKQKREVNSGCVPYDENLEPLATAEEPTECEAQMTQEVEHNANIKHFFTTAWSLLHSKMSKMVIYIKVLYFIICLAFHHNEMIVKYCRSFGRNVNETCLSLFYNVYRDFFGCVSGLMSFDIANRINITSTSFSYLVMDLSPIFVIITH